MLIRGTHAGMRLESLGITALIDRDGERPDTTVFRTVCPDEPFHYAVVDALKKLMPLGGIVALLTDKIVPDVLEVPRLNSTALVDRHLLMAHVPDLQVYFVNTYRALAASLGLGEAAPQQYFGSALNPDQPFCLLRLRDYSDMQVALSAAIVGPKDEVKFPDFNLDPDARLMSILPARGATVAAKINERFGGLRGVIPTVVYSTSALLPFVDKLAEHLRRFARNDWQLSMHTDMIGDLRGAVALAQRACLDCSMS